MTNPRSEYARLVREGKIRPRGRKLREIAKEDSSDPGVRHPAPGFGTPPPGEEANPVYQKPDSWEAHSSLQRGVVVEKEPAPMKKQGPRRKLAHKRRAVRLSISVSEEEEFLLRKYAFDQGETFSAWARIALFKAMGTPIPPRK